MEYNLDEMFSVELNGSAWIVRMWEIDGECAPIVGRFNNRSAADRMVDVLRGVVQSWVNAAQEAERFHAAAVTAAVRHALTAAMEATS